MKHNHIYIMEIVLDQYRLMKPIILVSTNKDKRLVPYYVIAEILLFHVVRQYVSLHVSMHNDSFKLETFYRSTDFHHQ
ncbi:hypothetical protein DERF_013827 [Dermatophagoides farinae]|uniref:Uncharacterized protein n=1 Tax=Dermatophagoides farinae TaxID=6954 RepID=A0A922L2Q1_DERFA|nr:hypothetical protein DERF_013827 [Dermatophagoides farinae]